jgi:AcrR family transcriptional regulator
MSPRKYELGRRREGSDATREKILEATRALFGGKGDLDGFSMDAVAAKAGVARMTVYNQFHSQGELLEALADHLAARAGMQRMADVFLEPRPDEAVRTFVATFVALWASDRVALRRLRAMGILVPSLYRKVRERDEWRRQAARTLVAKIGIPGPSDRPGEADWPVDLLTSATSFETFDALCDDRRPPPMVAQLVSDELLRLWGLNAPARRARAEPRPRATASRRTVR